MKLRRILSMLLAAALSLSVAACSGDTNTPSTAPPADETTAPAENGDKIVTIGLVTDITPMNCIEPKTEIGDKTMKLLYTPLVETDENLEYVYQIAESVTTDDNIHFTVKIREEANWSDGQPITAEDLAFSLDIFTDPVVGSTVWSDFFSTLADVSSTGMREEGVDMTCVEVVDEKTAVITCGQPYTLEYFINLTCLNLSVLPKHVLGGIDRAELIASDAASACKVVSGPFYLYDQVSGSNMVYAANENYFRGRPNLDYLRFVFLTTAQISAELASGEIDMAWPGLIDYADYEYIQSLDNVNTDVGVPNGIIAMFINNEIVDNVAIRRAMSMAIDRQMIVDSVLKGFAEPSVTPISSASRYYNPDITIPHDPDAAKALVESSGWDTSRTIYLTLNAGNTTQKNVALIIEQQLEAVGLSIELKESTTCVMDVLTGDYEMGLITQTEKPLFPAHTLGINIFSNNSWTKYNNPEMDALYLSLSDVVSEDELRANMDTIQTRYIEENPAVSLYNTTALLATNKRVTCGGPKIYGMFVNVEQWDVN